MDSTTSLSNILMYRTIKESVDYLYSIMHERSFCYGLRVFRKCNILMDSAYALYHIGIITNSGSQSWPKYHWTGDAPDESLYDKVRISIKQNNHSEKPKEYITPPFMQKIEEEKLADTYVVVLDSFSDVALWNELKKRGYSISDNKLVKNITLD